MVKAFDISLPLTGIGLLIALCAVMLRRQLHREYPYFFVYVVYMVLAAVFLAGTISNSRAYFYAYWISSALGSILALFALKEVFYAVFYRFYSFWWFRLIFPGVVVVMSFIAIRHALLKPFARAPLLVWVILSAESALSLIEAGILLALILLALGLRVHWRRYPFYIAMGFAVSGAGDWISQLVLSEFGTRPYNKVIRYLSAVTYICGTLVWLVCFSRKFEPEPKLKFGTISRPGSRTDAGSTPKLGAV